MSYEITEGELNAEKLNVIAEAGSTYRVRKYGGAWVPVVTVGNRVFTGLHCSTSGGAMASAINLCATRSAALLEVAQ
tara:strand:- start:1089 stop:1319 length:231 start_codon:yes stop_codon:yes gene_type:complete